MIDLKKALAQNPYRKDFPLLARQPLAYLDNAATSQRPACVLRAMADFYENANANPLRGLYRLSVEATDRYEDARREVQKFVNAAAPEEIVFTRNTTESLNLVAYSYGLSHLKAGDEILVSILEHHSNLLPWQMVAQKTGARLKFLDCTPDGTLTDEVLGEAFTPKTRLVAVAQVSNVLGRRAPLKKIVRLARQAGAVVVLDAAQSAPHMALDVQALDVDFAAFSGHKLMGPMGIGVLYGKQALLEEMPPFLTGGEMIETVTREGATYAPLPHKFEAGTVNAAGAVGLAAALRYLQQVGFEEIERRETSLTRLALTGLRQIPHLRLLGSEKAEEHCGILSFTLEGVHPHDISTILDAEGVNIRAGHHCAQPLLRHLGVSSTARASLFFYNAQEEIEAFLEAMRTVRRKMGYAD